MNSSVNMSSMGIDPDAYRQESLENWGHVAAGWEERREWMMGNTAPVNSRLVERLDPQPGQTILEVGAGTGDLGLEVAERLAHGGRVISTDFAPEMVEVARRQSKARNLTNVEHRVLDAEAMDLADDAVDGVVCRWAYMLMADPATALKETRRVLRPGGRLAFAVWRTAERNPWQAVPGMTLLQRGPERPGSSPLERPDASANWSPAQASPSPSWRSSLSRTATRTPTTCGARSSSSVGSGAPSTCCPPTSARRRGPRSCRRWLLTGTKTGRIPLPPRRGSRWRVDTAAARLQRQLRQAQDGDQRDRSQWRRDHEDELNRVDDVGPGRRPERLDAALRCMHPGPRGEDGAEHRGADCAAERTEKARGGGGDAELAALHAVLHRDDQHLGDHAEPEAEDHETDARGRLRGIARQRRQQAERRRHQRQAGDREALVAPGAGDAATGQRRGEREADHHRDQQQPGLRGAGVGRRLHEQRYEHGDREQRGSPEEQRRACDRHRPRAQEVEGDDWIGGPPFADDQGTGQEHGAGDQSENGPGVPGVAVAAPDADEHQRARRAGEQRRAVGVEWTLGPLGLGRREPEAVAD